MCFNTKTSFITWIIAVILSIYLYKRNKNYDRWNAGFILTFTFIQFLEGSVWLTLKYRGADVATINSILTTFILISLLYQPFTQSALGYKYSSSIGAEGTAYSNDPILKYSTLAFALIIGYTLFRIATTPMSNFSSTPGEEGHLVWNDKTHLNDFLGGGLSFIPYLYLAGLFLPLLYQGWRGIPLIIVGLATAYYSLRVAGRSEFGSYWCYTSVIYALVALLV